VNAMPQPSADVCLVLEGTYPYVAGGVSSWVHDLLQAHAGLRFSLVSLLPDPSWVKDRKYDMPGNVVELRHVYLQRLPAGRRSIGKTEALFRRLEPALLSLQSRAGLKELRTFLEALPRQDRGQYGREAWLNSEAAWALLLRMYEASMPETSFLDYFWTWRSLLGGLFSVACADLPRARVFHPVSTGYAGLLAARARIELGRPVLLTEHGIYTNERRIEIAMADWLFETPHGNLGIDKPKRDLKDIWVDTFVSYSKACYDAADLIVTLYTGNQEFQRRDGAQPEKLRIIPNGIDPQRFAKIARIADRPPTIALIGRVVPIKDVKTFIRAAGILREQLPDLKALVLGPTEEDEAYYAECRAIVQHLGLGATVEFKGRVRLEDWLGQIDAIVLTSISEAQPLVILEAGVAGVPSVATDVGACREMILGRADETPALGPGGAVCPLSNPAAVAAALLELLTNHEWRQRCGQAIRERVARHYNKADLDATYGALYRELAAMPDRV
jgi:polysaccharide biosynthesis protein PelF